MESTDSSPSSEVPLDRRRSLGSAAAVPPPSEPMAVPLAQHRRAQSLSSFPITSIDKHYALNNQILSAFNSLFEQKLYKIAYAIGLQFVELALLEIPKHGYFYSDRHATERQQNSADAMRVTQQLQQILLETEAEPSLEDVRVEKLARLAEEQASSVPFHIYEKDRATVASELQDFKAQQAKTGLSALDPSVLCQPLASLGEQMSATLFPPTEAVSATAGPIEEATLDDEGAYLLPRRAESLEDDRVYAPERNDSRRSLVEQTQSDRELERALFLSGMEVGDRVPYLDNAARPPTKSIAEIDIASLSKCHHEDFLDLRHTRRVRINHIDTYQGRLEGSINGCTVIAPLLCIHHFHNFASNPDPGLPDSTLRQVMDQETPAILPDVRQKLGLTKDALIIPSDVHDFLMDRGMLSQRQFLTVCGGNIMDDKHLDTFLKALDGAPAESRVAATLFFHEHVVAILRLHRGSGIFWYDVIDSLPYEETLSRNVQIYDDDDELRDAAEKNEPQHISTLSFSSSEWSDYIPYAARIRCVDEEALKVTLRWYACSKFTRENRTYIDMYAWDDKHSDFDPRVFQGFIWMAAFQ